MIPKINEAGKAFDLRSNPWTGGHAVITDGKTAFCRIYEVDAANRTCSVKTYGSDPITSGGDYTNVQWLSPYSSPDGAEVSYVPQVGTQALCVFQNGLPWIIGFFNPVTIDDETPIDDLEGDGVEPKASSAAQNKEKVNSGDFIFRTAGRCRVVLRLGGEIELEATKLCRRTYFPAQNRINDLSQNYEFRTDGGTIDWVHIDRNSDKTVCNTEWRDDVSRSNVIIDQKGSVETSSPTLIHRFAIGPGVTPTVDGTETFEPVFIRETFNDGKTDFKINKTAFTEVIEPDGSTTRGIGGYNFFQHIKPTGQILTNINNRFQCEILPTGETTVHVGIEEEKEENKKPVGGEGKFKLNIKPSGTTTLEVNKKATLTIQDSGQITVGVNGGAVEISISPSGEILMKSQTAAVVETPLVHLKSSKVKLGSGVSDVVPLGRLMLKMINKFIQTYNSHNHAALGAAPPAQTMQSIGEDVLSSSVEVQG